MFLEGNNQETNMIGMGATVLAWFTSFVHMMHPALECLLYIVSIVWLGTQIASKIKSMKRDR
jgi:hypothetical protein